MCDKCKHVNKSPNEYPCACCTDKGEHFQPMTNADRIRNMTDEELADFLEDVRRRGFQNLCCNDEFCDSDACDCCVHEWLQLEVKEGNSNEST